VNNFKLDRFVDAQEGTYSTVISELRQGEKQSHWIWFIFPQLDGLGKSATAREYSIKSIDEARAYLDHPVLGKRLTECCELLMDIESGSISEAFGFPDDLKLKSSMTLFSYIAGSGSVFDQVLQHHLASQLDGLSLEILSEMEE